MKVIKRKLDTFSFHKMKSDWNLYEIVKNDCDYQVGDILEFRKWSDEPNICGKFGSYVMKKSGRGLLKLLQKMKLKQIYLGQRLQKLSISVKIVYVSVLN